jgi:hypothetical protein
MSYRWGPRIRQTLMRLGMLDPEHDDLFLKARRRLIGAFNDLLQDSLGLDFPDARTVAALGVAWVALCDAEGYDAEELLDAAVGLFEQRRPKAPAAAEEAAPTLRDLVGDYAGQTLANAVRQT